MRNFPELRASRRLRRTVGRLVSVLACAALALFAACGKKGPPLAPLPRLPVPPAQTTASRAGDAVTIRFTVPNANVSGVRPADIERVDVYAWTGPDVPPARVFKLAKVVASVPVWTPPPPQEPDEAGNTPPPPPRTGPGVDQGAAAELREVLAADASVALEPLDTRKRRAPTHEPKVTPPDVVPIPPPLTRHYLVVGVNHGGKRGPAAPELVVALWPAPPAPPTLSAKTIETGNELAWPAPPNLRGPVQKGDAPPPAATSPRAESAKPNNPAASEAAERSPAPSRAGESAKPASTAPPAASSPSRLGGQPQEVPEAPSLADDHLLRARMPIPWPAVSVAYHVYEVPVPGATPAAPAQEGAAPALPARLTATPIATTTYTDQRVEYGTERCYAVRTVETIGALTVESEASPVACVKPTDVFPPAPPTSLAAVASEGAISLIWEANNEVDLAGYLVLRGVAPGAPVERLTPQPIRETTFRDTTAKPGTRYVYVVVAVDTATPPNQSAPSKPVEETAR